MLRALVALGLLGATQAWITSQTRARRSRLSSGQDAPPLGNWEDEGGTISAGQFAAPLGATGTDGRANVQSIGAYPAAGQAG
jgi:hypothetical protein